MRLTFDVTHAIRIPTSEMYISALIVACENCLVFEWIVFFFVCFFFKYQV